MKTQTAPVSLKALARQVLMEMGAASPSDEMAAELARSKARLEALNVLVRIEPDGEIRICKRDSIEACRNPVETRGSWYSPEEMFLYVRLNERERRLVRELKRIR